MAFGVRYNREEWRLFQPSPPDHWAERHAGSIIALCVAVIAFVLMHTTAMRAFQPPPPPEPEIHIVLEPPPLVPQTPPPEPNMLFPEQAVATSTNPGDQPTEEAEEPPVEVAMASDAEQELFLEEEPASTEVPNEEPPQPPTPPKIEEWVPTSQAELAKVQSLLEHSQRERRQLRNRQDAAAAEIHKRSVEAAGKEFLLNSDGAREGVIRTLDFEGFPRDVVDRVMERWDISQERRFISSEERTGRSFLNSAQTDQGTFSNVVDSGIFNVFVISSHAVARMATLETEVLNQRGYDPRSSRIRRVTFGIVWRDGNYDLGVTEIDIEEIR